MGEHSDLVAGLPRRTAHALHGLIEASKELNMPVTARKAMIFDEEATTARHTGAGLRHAHRLGLAGYTGRYWVPSNRALELRSAFEDRYLRETESLGG